MGLVTEHLLPIDFGLSRRVPRLLNLGEGVLFVREDCEARGSILSDWSREDKWHAGMRGAMLQE